jgi:hypothetical protein
MQPTALRGSNILGSAPKLAFPFDRVYSASAVRRLNSLIRNQVMKEAIPL